MRHNAKSANIAVGTPASLQSAASKVSQAQLQMPVTERPNRDALDKALDIYRDAMRPFIAQTLDRVPGRQAEDLIAKALDDDQANGFRQTLRERKGNLRASINAGDFPQIIGYNWHGVFSQELPANLDVQSKTGIIKEAYEKVRHADPQDLETERTCVYLFHIAEVLDLIGRSEEKREVESVKDQVLAASASREGTGERPANPVVAKVRPIFQVVGDLKEFPRRVKFALGMWTSKLSSIFRRPRESALPKTPTSPAPQPPPTVPTPPKGTGIPKPETTSGPATRDRTALITLYRATNGPRWGSHHKWASEAPLKEWYGVDTDDSGRVTKLDLAGNRLRGRIPSELGRLANLKWLDLSRNNIGGNLPHALGGLKELQRLRLSGNAKLTGCIPQALEEVPNNDLAEIGLPFCQSQDHLTNHNETYAPTPDVISPPPGPMEKYGTEPRRPRKHRMLR